MATSNAISILNFGSIQRLFPFRFGEVEDWSGIRVPHANLDHARILCCNFNNSDLSQSTMIQAILRGSSFCGANLEGVETGERVPLAGHAEYVKDATFSPDGLVLASSSVTGAIRLWDVQSSKCTKTLNCSSVNTTLDFSPDGALLAMGANDGSVRLWNLETQDCIATMHHVSRLNFFSTTTVTCVRFSPNGQSLASAYSDGYIRMWNLQSSQCTLVMKGHTNLVTRIHFAPNGRLLVSSGQDHNIRVWNTESGECMSYAALENPRGSWTSLSQDGRLLASLSGPGCIQLWSVEPLKPIKALGAQPADIDRIAFSPDGKLLASNDPYWFIRLWDVDSEQCVAILNGHIDNVRGLSFSPDGRMLVSFSTDTDIRLWPVPPFTQCETSPTGHNADVRHVKFTPNGALLVSSSDDRTIRVWRPESKQCISVLESHKRWGASIDISPDNETIASIADDGSICLLHINDGERLVSFGGDEPWGEITVAFSPDGKLLASGHMSDIRLWNVETHQLVSTMSEAHTNGVACLSFSPDGKRLASGGGDCNVRIWDIQGGESVATLEGRVVMDFRSEYVVSSLCFSPDGKLLAAGSIGDGIRVWNLESNECAAELTSPYDCFALREAKEDKDDADSGVGDGDIKEVVRFSPNGRSLVARPVHNTNRRISPDAHRCGCCWEGGVEDVRALSFSRDGKWLVSGAGNGGLTVWNVESAKYVATFQGHGRRITSLCFSPDGKWLATASVDSTTRLWSVNLPSLTLYECFGRSSLDLSHADFSGACLDGPLDQWVQWYRPDTDQARRSYEDAKLFGETAHLDKDHQRRESRPTSGPPSCTIA